MKSQKDAAPAYGSGYTTVISWQIVGKKNIIYKNDLYLVCKIDLKFSWQQQNLIFFSEQFPIAI